MSEVPKWEKVLWLTVHNGWESIFISDSKSDFLLNLYSTLWFDLIFNELDRMFKSIDWNLNWFAIWEFFQNLHGKFVRKSVQNWAIWVLEWKIEDKDSMLSLWEFNQTFLNLKNFFELGDNRNKKFTWIEVWEKISSISKK